MAEFVTISLESNECDICQHDNGEELISYILNDRCLRQQEIWSTKSKPSDNQIRKAHALCLDRWDHIMKKSFNRLCPLRRSWTGKQRRSCSLTKVNSSSLENLIISRTWTAIKSHCQENSNSDTDTHNINRSVLQTPAQDQEILEGADTKSRPLATKEVGRRGHEDGDLSRCSIEKLQGRISSYNQKIKDASAQLIALLQERDALNQEIEVRRVAIEQLLKLQTGAGKSQSVVMNTSFGTHLRNSLPV